MTEKRIALLGATSHIAKGLIERFLSLESCEVHLYARSPDKMRVFCASLPATGVPVVRPPVFNDFDTLFLHDYDVVINCIGVGTHHKLQGEFHRYFTVTEQYDNLILRYLLERNLNALYMCFSSGAVYGRELVAPAGNESRTCLNVNNVSPADFYSIARINSEAKHRALANLNIVDVRVFSYFSRHIDLDDGYFMTELINAILQGRTLETSGTNMVRDYVHPDDLFRLILNCLNLKNVNGFCDAVSLKPVEKFEILEYFSDNYGLKYEVANCETSSSPTGSKDIYCSNGCSSVETKYIPKFSSMDSVVTESAYLLNVP